MCVAGRFTRWRRVGMPAAALLLAVAIVVPGSGHAAAPRLPVLAVDPLPDVADLECRTEALPRWSSRGITGATLLLVDVSPGMCPLGKARSAELAEIRRSTATGSPNLAGLEGAGRLCAMEAGFVKAAVDLGIVREVFWVLPFDSFRSRDPIASLRAELKDAGFADDDIRTFAMQDGCFRGTAGGIPFAVCAIEGLPPISGPVLLSLDTGFILAAVATATTNPVAEIRRLLAALAARNYAVTDAVLSASVTVGHVPPDMRWIGETIAQAFHDPNLLARPEQPKRWDKLQSLAMLLSKRQYTDMFHAAWPLLAIHGEDPALHLFTAEAQLGLGKKEDALEAAAEACRINRGYCYGLPGIGLKLFAGGDIDGGERFFASGLRLRPGMMYGQFDRGLMLLAAGRREQALTVFQQLGDGGKAFPSGFLAGAISLQSGDRQSALQHFDRALAALRFEPEAVADHPETFSAIRSAAQFYREEGFAAKAELLESNPQLMPAGRNPPDLP